MIRATEERELQFKVILCDTLDELTPKLVKSKLRVIVYLEVVSFNIAIPEPYALVLSKD